MKDAASLVGALNQVAGFVISVAAVDGTASQRVLFAAGCWCAVLDGTLAFQTTHGVVGVGEGMAQRVGAFERQSVHCEFVGGFGTESVDVGGQSVEAVVFEGFVTAVGIVGTDGVARCVVVVAGGVTSGREI